MARARTALAFVAGLLAGVSAAKADGFLNSLVGRAGGKGDRYACFARAYDDAHLAAHPKQNVRGMKMLVRVLDPPQSPGDYELAIGSTFRSRQGELRTGGECSLGDDATGANGLRTIECSISCEGGGIGVSLRGSRSVLVRIPAGAQQWDPARPDNSLVKGAFGPDDKLFRLDRAPLAACAELGRDEKEQAFLGGAK